MSKVIEIVIVDDEQLQLNYMEKLLRQATDALKIDCEISQYLSGEAFLFALEDHPSWKLAFLDIEMETLNGMEVARIVREKTPDLGLVFATAYAEYAVEGYEVQALDYLLKPITLEKVTRVLERFLKEQPGEAAYIIVEIDGETTRVNLDVILYMEAAMGEVIIVLENKELSVKMTLNALKGLVDDRFVSTHRSYLVNLQFVSRLLKQDVQLSNKQRIPLSRRRSKDVQKAFIDYYKGSVFYGE